MALVFDLASQSPMQPLTRYIMSNIYILTSLHLTWQFIAVSYIYMSLVIIEIESEIQ